MKMGRQRTLYKVPSVYEGTQLANHANSASPSSASLSNSAAGYTTLGGKYQFATVSGAATDYALFAYLVPATHNLNISGIAISAVNTGAAVATTASILDWSIGFDGTAVDLSTTDSGSVYATRRIPIGTQSFIVGAAIGAVAPDIVRYFDNPLPIRAGRYLHVILQLPVGTATTSQVIRGDVFLDGFFDEI